MYINLFAIQKHFLIWLMEIIVMSNQTVSHLHVEVHQSATLLHHLFLMKETLRKTFITNLIINHNHKLKIQL